MSKLNKPNKSAKQNKVAYSYNGNPQFLKNAEQQLYEVVTMTLYGKDEFYESSNDRLRRLRELLSSVVANKNFDFLANLIVHARTNMNIRTMPIILCVEFAKALSDNRKLFLDQITTIKQSANGRELTDAENIKIATFQSKAEQFTYNDMRRVVCDVIQRADQITDLYAYALSVFGGKNAVPMAIRRGVADAFEKFNEYSLAKWN